MYPTTTFRPLIAVLLLALVNISACVANPSPSVIALPNGYYLQVEKGQIALVKRSGSTTLPGPIAAYSVYREIVTGAVDSTTPQHRSYANDLPWHGGPDARYFVLDTASGKLETGLDEAAWKARIAELGVKSGVEIYPPLLPE